jgi:hypothetical protein
MNRRDSKRSPAASNRTVLVERPTGESWVIKQALAKLRTKADWFSDPRVCIAAGHPLAEQAARRAPSAAGIRGLENHLIAMQAVPMPHEVEDDAVLRRVRQDRVGGCCSARFIASPASTAIRSRPRSGIRFFESLRLEPYYAYTAEQSRIRANFSTSFLNDAAGGSLVHGDYSPKTSSCDGS